MPKKRVKRLLFGCHRNWKCVLGLTGGFGSGKSTVLVMFRNKGAYIQDADKIVHDLLNKDKRVKKKIVNQFGKKMLDNKNNLNKKKMAEIIFKSKSKRKELGEILHPMVRHTIRKNLEKRKGRLAVCDVPLLFESGLRDQFDSVLVVNTNRLLRKKRLLKKGFSLIDIRKRIQAQKPLPQKIRQADFVIDNNQSKFSTRKKVNQLWNQLIAT